MERKTENIRQTNTKCKAFNNFALDFLTTITITFFEMGSYYLD